MLPVYLARTFSLSTLGKTTFSKLPYRHTH